jgi:hypothetical protein
LLERIAVVQFIHVLIYAACLALEKLFHRLGKLDRRPVCDRVAVSRSRARLLALGATFQNNCF